MQFNFDQVSWLTLSWTTFQVSSRNFRYNKLKWNTLMNKTFVSPMFFLSLSFAFLCCFVFSFRRFQLFENFCVIYFEDKHVKWLEIRNKMRITTIQLDGLRLLYQLVPFQFICFVTIFTFSVTNLSPKVVLYVFTCYIYRIASYVPFFSRILMNEFSKTILVHSQIAFNCYE